MSFVDIFNLKNISESMVMKINNEVSQVQNLPNLLAYFESNFNHLSIQKVSNYMKYVVLLKNFNKKVNELMAKEQLSFVPTRAKEFSDKVRNVTSAFYESEYKRIYLNYPHKQLHFRSFKDYFTREDIAILSTIGSLEWCIKIQQSKSGSDVLEDRIQKILKVIAIKVSSQNNVIGSSEKKALSMAISVCKGMGSAV